MLMAILQTMHGYAMLTLFSSIALTDTQDFVGVEAAAGPEGQEANSMSPSVKTNMSETRGKKRCPSDILKWRCNAMQQFSG